MLTRKKMIELLTNVANDEKITLVPSNTIFERFFDIINNSYIEPYSTNEKNYLTKIMTTDKDRLAEIAASLYMLYMNIFINDDEKNLINIKFFEKQEFIIMIRVLLSYEEIYNKIFEKLKIDLKEFLYMIIFLNYKILTYKNINELKKKFLNV